MKWQKKWSPKCPKTKLSYDDRIKIIRLFKAGESVKQVLLKYPHIR